MQEILFPPPCSPGVTAGLTCRFAVWQDKGRAAADVDGENGNIMLLLDAAQELHRSSSGGEDALEPSTAGSPPGEGFTPQ